jgi:surfactin synthase thioesterase subunit
VDDTGWFFVPAPRPGARLRLVCFAQAGGWPWEFRAWPAALPEIEVRAVCLPGRGRRAGEAAAATLEELAARLAPVLAPLLDRPYALFGHSFGALAAFETAAELARRGGPLPRRVFASGAAAPGTHGARAPLHTLPDAELLAAVRALREPLDAALPDPGPGAVILPLVREDLRLAERYRVRTRVLAAPITALFGRDDASAPEADVAEWRHHTSADFELHGFPGNHFFVHARPAPVLAAVSRGLAETHGGDLSGLGPAGRAGPAGPAGREPQ